MVGFQLAPSQALGFLAGAFSGLLELPTGQLLSRALKRVRDRFPASNPYKPLLETLQK